MKSKEYYKTLIKFEETRHRVDLTNCVFTILQAIFTAFTLYLMIKWGLK